MDSNSQPFRVKLEPEKEMILMAIINNPLSIEEMAEVSQGREDAIKSLMDERKILFNTGGMMYYITHAGVAELKSRGIKFRQPNSPVFKKDPICPTKTSQNNSTRKRRSSGKKKLFAT